MSETIRQENLLKTGNLEFHARQVVEGFITGMHKSPFHGFSVEFAEHRLYNTGESTRYIDWKLYARTDRLFVKRFEEETNLRCQIIIDRSSSMYFPSESHSKIRFSVYAAASLIYLLRKQRDACGISLINDQLEFHSACKSSPVHQKLLFSKLEEVMNQPNKNVKSNISTLLHGISEMIHKRSLVVLFSDMFQNIGSEEDLFASLQHLRYNKHDVILFHVEDKKTEAEFDFGNRPYQFIDSETGEKIKLFPSRLKEQYLEARKTFQQQLRLKCAQYRIELVEATVGEDFSQILVPFLVKRSKLY